jgi:hypothetical protein
MGDAVRLLTASRIAGHMSIVRVFAFVGAAWSSPRLSSGRPAGFEFPLVGAGLALPALWVGVEFILSAADRRFRLLSERRSDIIALPPPVICVLCIPDGFTGPTGAVGFFLRSRAGVPAAQRVVCVPDGVTGRRDLLFLHASLRTKYQKLTTEYSFPCPLPFLSSALFASRTVLRDRTDQADAFCSRFAPAIEDSDPLGKRSA